MGTAISTYVCLQWFIAAKIDRPFLYIGRHTCAASFTILSYLQPVPCIRCTFHDARLFLCAVRTYERNLQCFAFELIDLVSCLVWRCCCAEWRVVCCCVSCSLFSKLAEFCFLYSNVAHVLCSHVLLCVACLLFAVCCLLYAVCCVSYIVCCVCCVVTCRVCMCVCAREQCKPSIRGQICRG